MREGEGTHSGQEEETPSSENAQASDATARFVEILTELSHEFDDRTQFRHNLGETKYGPLKFLEVDTLDEALEEILDLGNYIRYTYIKLRLLQVSIAQLNIPETVPASKFISSKDFTKPGVDQ